MTARFGFDPAATNALEAWRIATGAAFDMAVNLSRKALFHRQDRACFLCGCGFAHRAMDLHGAHADAPSRDHVFPRAAGGRAEANILLAHKPCNIRKGSRWPHPCEVIYLAAIYLAPAPIVSINSQRKARAWARRK